MKKELSKTKFTITLMFFYLLSIIGFHLSITILEKINSITNINIIIYLIIMTLSLLTFTTIIPNIIIKKLLKNKTITTKDYKNIKKNIIIAFLILLIGILIYKTPNYIKDLNEATKNLNDYLKTRPNIQLYDDSIYIQDLKGEIILIKIAIKFEIIRILYTFGISIYFLINNIKNYINSNKNIKKFYIKRIIILIVTLSIYICLNIIMRPFYLVY